MSHWDGVRAKLPGFLVGRVFGIAGRACTKAEVDRASTFFTPKAADVEGAQRPLAEALEEASACQMLRDKDAGAVDKFFNVTVKSAVVVPAKVAEPKKTAPEPKKK
jgi:hypothetical protein